MWVSHIGSAIWDPYYVKDTDRLKKVQRQVATQWVTYTGTFRFVASAGVIVKINKIKGRLKQPRHMVSD